ncbi:MAG: TIGR01777 family oxidoreductase [Thermodesulfobacteriota bacterium]
MKILITGGSGFVGTALGNAFLDRGHRVTAIGGHEHRHLPQNPDYLYIAADTSQKGSWQELVSEQDLLVNLAGRSVFHLWSSSYKKELYESRILTTHNLVEAITPGSTPTLISGSAAGFYGDGGDELWREEHPPGSDFLARLCVDWEKEALTAVDRGCRVALARFGVILGREGGALKTMKTPFKLGLGGPLGSGRQWFPWIHLTDVIGGILHIVNSPQLDGPVNFCAPAPVRQKEFAAALAARLHRPHVLPAPASLIRLFLGEFGASLLQGQKVHPGVLEREGYPFRHHDLQTALADLL